MTPRIREYVVSITHAEGCPRLRTLAITGAPVKRRGGGRQPCLPGCKRIVDGWEYDIQPVMLADGTLVPGERRRFPAHVDTAPKRRAWASARAAELLARGKDARRSRAKVPTLSAFWTRFVAERLQAGSRRPSTIAGYRSCYQSWLEPTLGEKRLDEIGEADAAKIRAALAEAENGAKTGNNVIGTLSTILGAAAKWKLIPAAPRFERVKAEPPDYRYYPEGEFRKLAAAAARLGPLHEVAVLLGGDGGLRLGEARALLWTDVVLSRRELRVQRSDWEGEVGCPKGKRAKTVPMSTALVDALRRLPRAGDRLLMRDGLPLRDEDVHALVAEAQRASGAALWLGHGDEQSAVVDISGNYHPLRHTCASRLFAAGEHPLKIKEHLRHATLDMTLRYSHLAPADRASTAQALDRAAAAQSPDRGAAAGQARDRLAAAQVPVRAAAAQGDARETAATASRK